MLENEGFLDPQDRGPSFRFISYFYFIPNNNFLVCFLIFNLLIRKRNLKNGHLIFRENNLLKKFSKAYNYGEGPLISFYDKILSTFQDITEKNKNEINAFID